METAASTYTPSHNYSGIGLGIAPVEKITAVSSISKPEDNGLGKAGFSFGDLLDVINPLQHLPVISTIYRALTDDEIAPGARLIGGAIFGGPLGFASAMANSAIEEATGKDVGEHVMALVGFGSEDSATETPSTSSKAFVSEVPTVVNAPVASETSSQVAQASIAATAPISRPDSAISAVVQQQPAPAATSTTLPYSIKSSALSGYQNTVWGTLLSARQPEQAATTKPLLPASISPIEQAPRPQSAVVQNKIEHLTAQEFTERLMFLTRAFSSTFEPRNKNDDHAYSSHRPIRAGAYDNHH